MVKRQYTSTALHNPGGAFGHDTPPSMVMMWQQWRRRRLVVGTVTSTSPKHFQRSVITLCVDQVKLAIAFNSTVE
jgi:hypothetical protein